MQAERVILAPQEGAAAAMIVMVTLAAGFGGGLAGLVVGVGLLYPFESGVRGGGLLLLGACCVSGALIAGMLGFAWSVILLWRRAQIGR